jgi:hypothetical protein
VKVKSDHSGQDRLISIEQWLACGRLLFVDLCRSYPACQPGPPHGEEGDPATGVKRIEQSAPGPVATVEVERLLSGQSGRTAPITVSSRNDDHDIATLTVPLPIWQS